MSSALIIVVVHVGLIMLIILVETRLGRVVL